MYLAALAVIILLFSSQPQTRSTPITSSARQSPLPRFEDYPVAEAFNGPAAPVRIISPDERMFRTRLTGASKQPPNFAAHYRFAGWGCGTVCAAGAIIDLKTGVVYPPPLGEKKDWNPGWGRWGICTALFDDKAFEYRIDSSLMIIRCGWNYDAAGANHPDVYYLLWQGSGFKELLHIHPPRAQ